MNQSVGMLSTTTTKKIPSKKILGADAFLPIFIYVIVQSQLKNIIYIKEILNGLCETNKKLSETGYYIASFEAALFHIQNMSVNND